MLSPGMKTTFKSKKAMAAPVGGNYSHQSVSVEKIANGFLARHSHTDSQGNYKDKTVYHEQRPTFVMRPK